MVAKEAQATNTNLAENAKGAASRLQALHYQQVEIPHAASALLLLLVNSQGCREELGRALNAPHS